MPALAAVRLTMAFDVALGELAAAHAAGEHGVIVAGVAPKGEEGAADNLGQRHLAHLAALASDR
jgi:hypothetical protein